jgi:hypothetical protein
MRRFRSVLSAVALNVDRQTKELLVILLKPVEVRLDRSRDFPRVFDRKEMADDLTIMFSLTRQTKRRIFFLRDFCSVPGIGGLDRV